MKRSLHWICHKGSLALDAAAAATTTTTRRLSTRPHAYGASVLGRHGSSMNTSRFRRPGIALINSDAALWKGNPWILSLSVRSLGTSSSFSSSSTTNSSIPLSPFEESATTTTTTTQQDRPSSSLSSSSSKSQAQVWQDLSDQLLLSSSAPSTTDPSTSSKEKKVEQNNLRKECIQWWIRQRPISTASQTYVWKLWEQYSNNNNNNKNTSDNTSLWLAVLDHWRLAVTEAGVMIRTPEQVWQDLQSDDNNNKRPSIKAYGLLLDVLAQLDRPHEAERLLHAVLDEKQQQRQHSNPRIDPESALVLFNTVLTAWAKSTRAAEEAPARAVALFTSMGSAVDVISYATTLEALAKGIMTANNTTVAGPGHVPSSTTTNQHNSQQMMEQLEDLFARAVQEGNVSAVAWLQRLQAWGAVHRNKAKALLYTLRQEYLASNDMATADNNSDNKIIIPPNHHLFTAVMSAFAKVGDFETVQQLWEDLHELDARYGSPDQDAFVPSPAALGTVLHAFGRAQAVPDRAEKAQALLQVAMEQTPHVVDRTAFNCVVDAWAGSKNRGHIESIQDLMEFMRQSGTSGNSTANNLEPDTYTYNSLLKALSRSNRRDCLDLSRRVLKKMWDLHEAGSELVKPNHITYSTILHSYSRLATPSVVKDAEDLFEEFWRKYNIENDPALLPNEAAYVSIITAWIRSKRKEAPSRAAFYFDHMRAKYAQTNDRRFQPSVRIYNTLIDSYKVQGDGPGAELILRRMINDYRDGNAKAEPTTVSFNTVMTAFAKSGHRRAPEKVERILQEMEGLSRSEGWACSPNTWTYSIVLEAWSSLRSTNGAKRAEAIFRGLQQYYESTGDERVRPSNYCYNICLNAWAKSGDPSAPEKTTELFEEMQRKYEEGDEELKPSGFTYTALLSAWSRSRRLDSASRALAVLNEMEDRYKLDPGRSAKPDTWHYSTVIHAFANQGDVENAEAVFNRIVRNREGVNPNQACWNGVLKAYARSNIVNGFEKAKELLRNMYALSDQGFGESSPDTAIYTTLFEMLRSSGRENAFDEGLLLLDEMFEMSSTRRRLRPDAAIFLAMLRILHKCSVPNKSECLDRLVGLMKKEKIRPSYAIRDAVADCRHSIEIEN